MRSAQLRHRLVTELAVPGTIGYGNHFTDVVFGRVRRNGAAASWHALEG